MKLPNIETPTLGGKVFWKTIKTKNGWKLQQNSVTKHCRILDEWNVRKTWGDYNTMCHEFNKLAANEVSKKGDILVVKRRLYMHYAVYVGENQVVHYAAANGDFGKNSVHQAPFDEFLRGSEKYYILKFPEKSGTLKLEENNRSVSFRDLFSDIHDYKLFSPSETVKRAKSRIGE